MKHIEQRPLKTLRMPCEGSQIPTAKIPSEPRRRLTALSQHVQRNVRTWKSLHARNRALQAKRRIWPGPRPQVSRLFGRCFGMKALSQAAGNRSQTPQHLCERIAEQTVTHQCARSQAQTWKQPNVQNSLLPWCSPNRPHLRHSMMLLCVRCPRQTERIPCGLSTSGTWMQRNG